MSNMLFTNVIQCIGIYSAEATLLNSVQYIDKECIHLFNRGLSITFRKLGN